VTINEGYSMRAWFDVYGLHAEAKLDESGIREAQDLIVKLINKEIEQGIPSQRIILAGFSQGGGVALFCGLRFGKPLAGILGLSTFLPLADSLDKERNPVNNNISIMLGHGTGDPLIPFQWGELCRDKLKSLGYRVSWHAYPMQHEVSLEEVRDVAKWLNEILK
jgi:phospholipase/carboxylesterase